MSELPRGWRLVSFESLVENLDGKRIPVKLSDRAGRQGEYPYYGASGIIDWVDNFLFDGSYLLIAEDGANLLSRSTPIAFQAHGKFWVNNHAHVTRPLFGAPIGYLEAFLNSLDLRPFVTGTAQPKLTQKALNRIQVPVAPVDEQHRIVAKLDALKARSRRAREALDAVPPLLEKLRQSILATAFRGDLTKDWRAKNKDVEPATELLKRIRHERRKKWEETELAKMKAKGKTPTDDKWKAKYKEPEPVDTTGLPQLPEGWCWASLDELAIDGPTNGFSPKSDGDGSGTPTLKLSATTSGECILNDATTKRTREPVPADAPYWLKSNDVLVQRANTLQNVGVAAVFTGPGQTFIYPDLMMRIRVSELTGPAIVWRALNWEFCRAYMRDRATGTAGNMPKINAETVRSVPIPLPHVEELRVLLERLDDALARGRASLSLDTLSERLSTLERAVLAKAFRGQLISPKSVDDSTLPFADPPPRVSTGHQDQPVPQANLLVPSN